MNETAIESLRSFAVANNEIDFAHLCSAALAGEEWAVKRLASVTTEIIDASWTSKAETLRVICSTDTARPDGAIARKMEI